MILLLPLSQYKKRALEQEQPDLSDYPKYMKMKDAIPVTIRPMMKGDGKMLLEFFKNLPPRDRLFLKDDVTNPRIIQEWEDNLDFLRVIPILALKDDQVIGDATLHRNAHGWSRHLAEIRMVTAKAFREKGLGLLLAKEIYFLAQKLRIEKVMAQMMNHQMDAIRVFEKLGFQKEAELKNTVMDLNGKKHHLVIMTQDITVLWHQIENLMYDLEDHGG